MAARLIDIHEAQSRLAELLALVREGTEIVLTEDSTPVARLVPVSPASNARIAGLHAGAIWTSDDFDEPLPDEFWLGTS